MDTPPPPAPTKSALTQWDESHIRQFDAQTALTKAHTEAQLLANERARREMAQEVELLEAKVEAQKISNAQEQASLEKAFEDSDLDSRVKEVETQLVQIHETLRQLEG